MAASYRLYKVSIMISMTIEIFTNFRGFVSDEPILSEFSAGVTTLVQLMWCAMVLQKKFWAIGAI